MAGGSVTAISPDTYTDTFQQNSQLHDSSGSLLLSDLRLSYSIPRVSTPLELQQHLVLLIRGSKLLHPQISTSHHTIHSVKSFNDTLAFHSPEYLKVCRLLLFPLMTFIF